MTGLFLIAGLAGAVAYVAVIAFRARSDATARRALLAERRQLGSTFEATCAAYIGSWYVSWPLARIVVADDCLAIFGRWGWIPLPPARIVRAEVAGLRVRHRFTGSEQLDVLWATANSKRVRVWVNRDLLARIDAEGWTLA